MKISEEQFNSQLNENFNKIVEQIKSQIKSDSWADAYVEITEGRFEFAFARNRYSKTPSYYGYSEYNPNSEEDTERAWDQLDKDAQNYISTAEKFDVEVEVITAQKARITGTYGNIVKALEEFGLGCRLSEIKIEEYDIENFEYWVNINA